MLKFFYVDYRFPRQPKGISPIVAHTRRPTIYLPVKYFFTGSICVPFVHVAMCMASQIPSFPKEEY